VKYRRFLSFLTLSLLSSTVTSAHNTVLTLRQDDATNTISVYRENVAEPILTQNARPDFRPYLHPIVAPDGCTISTSPALARMASVCST
jgi:hypothetical protein